MIEHTHDYKNLIFDTIITFTNSPSRSNSNQPTRCPSLLQIHHHHYIMFFRVNTATHYFLRECSSLLVAVIYNATLEDYGIIGREDVILNRQHHGGGKHVLPEFDSQ